MESQLKISVAEVLFTVDLKPAAKLSLKHLKFLIYNTDINISLCVLIEVL